MNFITIYGRLKSFSEKINIWKPKIINCKFGFFPIVDENINKLDIRMEIENTSEKLSE